MTTCASWWDPVFFDIPVDPGYNKFAMSVPFPENQHASEEVQIEQLLAADLDRVLVVGHRGAEALAPENTWAAFEAGYSAGADLLEVDVQLTRDGEAIIFHDFTLQPKLADPRWVRDLDWSYLSGLDVGSWFGPTFAGQRIPRFLDLLDWARGRIALQVDLKHGFAHPDDDRLAMLAVDLIERTGMEQQVVVSSWDRVALSRIRSRKPGLVLAVNLRERFADPVAQVAPTGARWVTVFWPQADQLTITLLRESGLVVCLANLFTANYGEALRLGVHAVTATDPRAARAALDSAHGPRSSTIGSKP